ncbi:hypothetical protein GIB67_005966 [Kingdonia uniflora]|uniref:Rx N-terminal domain-containing protein n=1 Tax=Kingdonia uniflora TaxID=39325 RepID=A0A7J7MBV4_9MAGN|nr:hypothetical protein GIB67_005966 [Kingdonia uniflora]
MAEALVSGLKGQLRSFLLENLKEEVALVAGARGEIEKLAATFENILAVLNDAESQQVKKESVKVWLLKLKDIAYDIEDVLEEWHTRILKSQIDGVDDNVGLISVTEMVSSSALFLCSFFNKLILHDDIGRKMKKLRERLELRELSNLNNLRGSLAIANIKGGGSKESIGDANLKNKEHLRTLLLQFVKEAYEGKRDDDDSAIELFEPHPNLEELEIWYYGGSKLPNWMEFPTNQSSSIMLCRLQIGKCRNLEVLPPIAKLESLQYLYLEGLDSMSAKGLFNGLEASSTTVAYPNLKKLVINGQKHWEEWVMETSSENINVMPLLRDLYILNCPVLKSVPHQILSLSVRKLFIKNCPELRISCLPPLLEELTLDGDAGSLSSSFPFKNNTSLKVMWIQDSPHLTLPRGLSQFKTLLILKILDCNSLMCIPDELRHVTSLHELVIARCSILGPRCEKEVGKDWSIISHIPNIIYG